MENKWLNYHHLLYFRVIATEGSISKASEKLLVGQPSLSSQLKNLEDSLGQQLFLRQNRSLVLTEAGKLALEYANEIFLKGEEFMQVFNDENLARKFHYKIGVVDSAPKILTCDLTEFAQKVGDNCLVTLTEGTPKELIESLNNHKLDLVLSTNKELSNQEDLIVSELATQPISAYASSDFAHLVNDFPESLNDQPIILPTRHTQLRYDLEQFIHSHKIHYNLIAEVQDSSVKKLMAEHGKGVIFLPDFAALPLVKDKRLIKIGNLEGVSETYWLIAKKRTISTPISDLLIKDFKLQV
jgi:LysR family transcriptional activator of nhaA